MFLLNHFLFVLVVSAHPLAQHKTLPNGLVVSYTGMCGTQNGQTCLGSKYGDSCSKWGFCGSGETFSGPGCIQQYGKCDGVAPVSTKTVHIPPASQSALSASSTIPVDGLPSQNTPPTASDHDGKPKPSSHPGGNDAFIQGPAPTGGNTGSNDNPSPPTNTAASAPSRPPFPVVFNNGKPNPVPLDGFIAENPGDPTATAPPSSFPGSPGDNPGSNNPSDDPTDPSHGQPGSDGKIPPKLPYKMYSGDGNQGWPTMDQWYSFDAIWDANLFKINTSCQAFGTINNSPAETAALRAALLQFAKSTNVDERFVVAVMLQESQGCVRVPTTNYGVSNPGLFQSHAGQGSCNSMGEIQHPCPDTEITQMVQDGVAGTAQGMGLEQTIAKAPGSGAAKFYQGARIYNSGSIDPSGDLGAGVATHCYATDVANRLLGWTSKTRNGCTLDRGY